MNPHKASALLHYIGKVKKLTGSTEVRAAARFDVATPEPRQGAHRHPLNGARRRWAWASRQYRHTKSGVVRLVAAHIHDKQPAPRVKRGRPGINPTAIP